jgi:hypothetical protein
MTAASTTPGSSSNTDSTSQGWTFSPPEMYMSFYRSRMNLFVGNRE